MRFGRQVGSDERLPRPYDLAEGVLAHTQSHRRLLGRYARRITRRDSFGRFTCALRQTGHVNPISSDRLAFEYADGDGVEMGDGRERLGQGCEHIGQFEERADGLCDRKDDPRITFSRVTAEPVRVHAHRPFLHSALETLQFAPTDYTESLQWIIFSFDRTFPQLFGGDIVRPILHDDLIEDALCLLNDLRGSE